MAVSCRVPPGGGGLPTPKAMDLPAVALRRPAAFPVIRGHATNLRSQRLASGFAVGRLLVQRRCDVGWATSLRQAANADDVLERRLPQAHLIPNLNHLRALGARAV